MSLQWFTTVVIFLDLFCLLVITARQWSCGKANVFRHVCLSVQLGLGSGGGGSDVTLPVMHWSVTGHMDPEYVQTCSLGDTPTLPILNMFKDDTEWKAGG